ncbi:ATP-binding protein [Candidatus Protofrankia californiensis]|uniref:ATP-binding protein n=1 Tax=Candidatus Protofrankia californiensis TaxID=1839754 RepID=UPI001041B5BD|nr:hypothetical protein [Candidatus Protofrankia californiensis]
MAPLRLDQLIFAGTEKAPVQVQFGPRLNVIHGPSDTGKTFAVDAVNYMLGAATLRDIREAGGYTHVLLQITFPDESSITLVRPRNGGGFKLYEGAMQSPPEEKPDLTLAEKHNTQKPSRSLSGHLMEALGLGDRRIRKNAKGVTVSLTFRQLVHLCLVDEKSMISLTSPVLSGQYISRTSELSVFKFLLTGEDDSDLRVTDQSEDQKKIGKGRSEVIEQLANSLRRDLADAEPLQDLEARRDRLVAAITSQSATVQSTAVEYDQVVLERSNLRDQLHKQSARSEEVRQLLARFELLGRQYESDLARLAMMQEAGSILGIYGAEVCVFCGATPDHQQISKHVADESARFGDSIASEVRKTQALRDDLDLAMGDLGSQIEAIERDIDLIRDSIGLRENRLLSLEGQLRPSRQELSGLVQERADVERAIDLYGQLSRVEGLRDISPVAKKKEAAEVVIPDAVLDDFLQIVSQRLRSWGFGAVDVKYDRGAADIVIDGRPRGSRGKGMRSILHSAFNLSLAEYCTEFDVEHPGIVILDSPLVTYSAPEAPSVSEIEDEAVDPSVAEAFFRSLADLPFQVLVVENISPPRELGSRARLIPFSGRAGVGRYGLFPAP